MKTTFKVTDKGRRELRQAIAQLNAWVKSQTDEVELSFLLSATVYDDTDEAERRTGKLFEDRTSTEGEA